MSDERRRLTDAERDQVRAYFAGIIRDRRKYLLREDCSAHDLVEWCDGRMDGIIGLLVNWEPKIDPALGTELQELKTEDYLAAEGWHGWSEIL